MCNPQNKCQHAAHFMHDVRSEQQIAAHEDNCKQHHQHINYDTKSFHLHTTLVHRDIIFLEPRLHVVLRTSHVCVVYGKPCFRNSCLRFRFLNGADCPEQTATSTRAEQIGRA